MLSTVAYIRERLSPFYREGEIKSFICWLMEDLAGIPPYRLIMMEDELDENTKKKITDATERLARFEPIQYIIGKTRFCGHTFNLTSSVLIPRPETAGLVQMIIQDFKKKPATILDIGTGSGCIAISLASELPKSKVTAVDISEEALIVAKENAKQNNVDIDWLLMDILSDESLPLLKHYDCIVSNPPYVMENEKDAMEHNVLDYEPQLALFVPNDDPLLFYRRIAHVGKKFLKKGGCLYFEINERFGTEMINLLEHECFHEIELSVDYNGKDRFIKAQL
ncbi:MAG TPA: peptide chain release factor N(5)-glutamine methyltransferase [Parabacteroides sp.]|nr:peptide chain release factor N(5)-glutamine methyltransferase [Parabacteroides sp.]